MSGKPTRRHLLTGALAIAAATAAIPAPSFAATSPQAAQRIIAAAVTPPA